MAIKQANLPRTQRQRIYDMSALSLFTYSQCVLSCSRLCYTAQVGRLLKQKMGLAHSTYIYHDTLLLASIACLPNSRGIGFWFCCSNSALAMLCWNFGFENCNLKVQMGKLPSKRYSYLYVYSKRQIMYLNNDWQFKLHT